MTGWWFGNRNFMTFHSVWNFIIPTDFQSIIFQRVGQPLSTTNQMTSENIGHKSWILECYGGFSHLSHPFIRHSMPCFPSVPSVIRSWDIGGSIASSGSWRRPADHGTISQGMSWYVFFSMWCMDYIWLVVWNMFYFSNIFPCTLW